MIYPDLNALQREAREKRDPLVALFLYGLRAVLIAGLVLSVGLIVAAIVPPRL